MPSAFAHALVGASIASALPRRGRGAGAALALGALAAAPDLDVVGFAFGIPYDHPLGHRGLTHSLFFAALVGVASLPLWHRSRPGHARLAAGLTFLALASHGLLDTFTDAGLGIGLLLPFDDGRYFAPWRPIATSPLSVASFLSPRGLSVLANEAVWVGLPVLTLLTTAAALRRARGAPDGD